MAGSTKVLVGLGNPGKKYVGTRHNVGFEVVAELARRHGGAKPKLKFEAEIGEVIVADAEVAARRAPDVYERQRSGGAATGRFLPDSLLPIC